MFLFVVMIVLYVAWQCRVYYCIFNDRAALSHIPRPPLDNIISGHARSVNAAKKKNQLLDLYVKWVEDHGKTIIICAAARPTIFTVDPVVLKQLTTDIYRYQKINALPNRRLFGQKLAGTDSILTASGLRWATKRKTMIQFFAKTNMNDLFEACKPHMENKQLHRWKTNIQEGKTVNLHDELAITFTSFLQIFGLKDFMDPETIANNVAKLLDVIPKQQYQYFSTIISDEKQKSISMILEMRAEAKKVVAERTEQLRNSDSDPIGNTDMLGYLIQANSEESIKMSDESLFSDESDIADNEFVVDDIMVVCLVWDNMVKQICALFMFLEKEPAVQKKMFHELRRVQIDSLGDLSKLNYSEKCILEAMRMGPALLRGARSFDNEEYDGKIGEYDLTVKRVFVHFSDYVMHHNPQVWKDPKRFNPDRWTAGFTPEPFSYMPFFAGARGCIAKHMAMMIMKLTLSVLAKNFDMEQRFDARKPPAINQSYAVMRILNTVDVHVSPFDISKTACICLGST